MTLEELKQIKESLEECEVAVETFDWGPTYELAQKRRSAALTILRREIRRIQKESS